MRVRGSFEENSRRAVMVVSGQTCRGGKVVNSGERASALEVAVLNVGSSASVEDAVILVCEYFYHTA